MEQNWQRKSKPIDILQAQNASITSCYSVVRRKVHKQVNKTRRYLQIEHQNQNSKLWLQIFQTTEEKLDYQDNEERRWAWRRLQQGSRRRERRERGGANCRCLGRGGKTGRSQGIWEGRAWRRCENSREGLYARKTRGRACDRRGGESRSTLGFPSPTCPLISSLPPFPVCSLICCLSVTFLVAELNCPNVLARLFTSPFRLPA